MTRLPRPPRHHHRTTPLLRRRPRTLVASPLLSWIRTSARRRWRLRGRHPGGRGRSGGGRRGARHRGATTEGHRGTAAEVHLWRAGLAERLVHLEELLLLEVEHVRDHRGGERLHAPV